MRTTYARMLAFLAMVLCTAMAAAVVVDSLSLTLGQRGPLIPLASLAGLVAAGALREAARAGARTSGEAGPRAVHPRAWTAGLVLLGYLAIAASSPGRATMLGPEWPIELLRGGYPARTALGAALAGLAAAAVCWIGMRLAASDMDRALKSVFRLGAGLLCLGSLLQVATGIEIRANALWPWFAGLTLGAMALARIPANRVFVRGWLTTSALYLGGLMVSGAALAALLGLAASVAAALATGVWHELGSGAAEAFDELSALLADLVEPGEGLTPVTVHHVPNDTMMLVALLVELPAIVAFAWLGHRIWSSTDSSTVGSPVWLEASDEHPHELREPGSDEGEATLWSMLRELVAGRGPGPGGDAPAPPRMERPPGVALYHRLLRRLASRGQPMVPSHTPTERAARLAPGAPDLPVREITTLFNGVYYGGQAADPEHVARLESELD